MELPRDKTLMGWNFVVVQFYNRVRSFEFEVSSSKSRTQNIEL